MFEETITSHVDIAIKRLQNLGIDDTLRLYIQNIVTAQQHMKYFLGRDSFFEQMEEKLKKKKSPWVMNNWLQLCCYYQWIYCKRNPESHVWCNIAWQRMIDQILNLKCNSCPQKVFERARQCEKYAIGVTLKSQNAHHVLVITLVKNGIIFHFYSSCVILTCVLFFMKPILGTTWQNRFRKNRSHM